jgi:anti-sigma B factor antagonist
MSEAQLSIAEKNEKGVCVISITGDIDAHTAPALKSAIDKAISSGKIKIVFDFSKLNYISSAGIGVFNAALNDIKGKSGSMGIANANKVIEDTLDVMYFTRKVRLYLTVDDAIKNA